MELITITKDDNEYFKSISFVAEAASFDKDSEVYSYIYCSKNEHVLFSTDGRRLHKTKKSSLESGLYKIIKRGKSEIILHREKLDLKNNIGNKIIEMYKRSKNYHKEIMKDKKKKRIRLNFYFDQIRFCKNITKIIKIFPKEIIINFDYLKNLNDIFDFYYSENKTGMFYAENESQENQLFLMGIALNN